jgi:hypothetical protein
MQNSSRPYLFHRIYNIRTGCKIAPVPIYFPPLFISLAQVLMIIAVFVSQCDGEDALTQHRRLLMGDQILIAWIWNDCIQATDKSKPPIRLAEQQRSSIGGDASAIKIRQHRSSTHTGKGNGL